ncbi:CRP-like cAMP-binding protein [Skermanella aerolata]|uniref:Crp/Fnr family transcriptional regulator n=1 Tax=Skermanella aerolata TaxID=393310 RepID=UPI0011BDF886
MNGNSAGISSGAGPVRHAMVSCSRRPPAGRGPYCRTCLAWDQSLCRQIAGSDFDRLFPNGIRYQTREAGVALFHQGQPFDQVLIIRSGWVLTYKVFQDGQRQIIRFALPGDLIGFEGDDTSGMAYTAEALSDVTLCSFKRSLFYGVCSSSPQMAMNFAAAVTREALAAWNHVGALGQQSAMGRVANLLLDLHRRAVAQCGADGPAVRLPINQIHIADATGLTSVHVCRTLKQMKLERLLEFGKGQLVLLDPERLAEIAQLDPEVELYQPPLAVA